MSMSIWRLYKRLEREAQDQRIREHKRTPKKERPRCGARWRDGHLCHARAVWDFANDRPRNGRCRMHGGLSTGPRTAEGKRRGREAARLGGLEKARRWRAARLLAEQEQGTDGQAA